MPITWEHRYAQRVSHMGGSAIRELLHVTERRNMISFAGGLPAPEVFPIDQISAISERVLRADGVQALQYSATEGYRPLRDLIAERMTRSSGIAITAENVLITSGSQQALDLLGRVLLNTNDLMLTESPTYMGALQAWRPYNLRYITVPMDDEGMQIDDLEAALQSNPKGLYLLPTFQNPTGVSMSLQRRQEVVRLAGRYGIPIIEDDPYSQLRFEGDELPSLFSLDKDESGAYAGHVLHLSTFSKVIAPGLRLGWIIAPKELIRTLVQAKQGIDLHTATFTQMIAYELAKDGFIEEHVPVIRNVYKERRDTMLSAMEDHFPTGVEWTHPEGGMFLWVTLPESIDAVHVLRDAIAYNVVYVPGGAFHPNGGGENTMRINFSNPTPEQIYAGITRLGLVLQNILEKAAI